MSSDANHEAQASVPEGAASTAPSGARGRSTKHAVTARTKARRRAVEILFEADQRGLLKASHNEADRFDEALTGSNAAATRLRKLAAERAVNSANHTEAPAYTREILAGVADHLAEIDEALDTHAKDWSVSRMPAVDRAIARVATWEIIWNDDVDAPVAVDEALTLAKMLSTDDSPRFLGGLLGRLGDLADTLR
ncbi:N utilization substance protein B homolog [Actinomyces bovis]|uniref:Transcription antitermination protein NusB n=1 Tax=Actinomyces bovis TaxID=1658 RepID=A0ABY1VQH8_9ACTO|nr:transcription antitermination factor NusB [Actinomyces bovis]SPT54053.1 N utilization substance protein B homolog [Actinomyces bovis]VEG53772.1 N utilization substance protein B homolog [Actinomyces israelii]